MYVVVLVFGIMAFSFCWVKSNVTKGDMLATPYFHPLYFIGLFCFLISVDFFLLGTALRAGDYAQFSGYSVDGLGNYNLACVAFIYMSTSSIAGFCVGMRWSVRGFSGRIFWTGHGNEMMLYIPLMVCVVTVVLFIMETALSDGGNISSLAGIRAVYFQDKPLLSIAMLCLVPSFFMVNSIHRYRIIYTISVLVLVAICLIVGSRGGVVMVLFAALVRKYHNERISVASILSIGTGTLGVGYYYTYITRFSGKYDTIEKFIYYEGGPIKFIFNSPEMSIAESMTLHIENRFIYRNWYDSVVGVIFALVPRSVISWKPVSLSAALSEYMNPERWALVKSEWTVSGYVNAIYEFGWIGGILFNFGIFLILGALFSSALRRQGPLIYILCCEAYLLLGYIRGDIYNFGLRIWAIAVPLLLVFVFWPILKRYGSRPEKELEKILRCRV